MIIIEPLLNIVFPILDDVWSPSNSPSCSQIDHATRSPPATPPLHKNRRVVVSESEDDDIQMCYRDDIQSQGSMVVDDDDNESQENGEVDIVEPAYHIRRGVERVYANNAARDIPFHVRFNEVWARLRKSDLLIELGRMMREVLDVAGQGMNGDDLGRILIYHENLDNPIVIPLQLWSRLTPELIKQVIENVLNSHQNLTLNTSFHIVVGAIHLHRGFGRLPILNEQSYRRKHAIKSIENTDRFCMARAIAVCYAHVLPVVSSEKWKILQAKYPHSEGVVNAEIAVKECVISRSTLQHINDSSRKDQDAMCKYIMTLAGLENVQNLEIKPHLPMIEEALDVQIWRTTTRTNVFTLVSQKTLNSIYN